VSDSLSKPHREEEVDDLAIELCDFLSGRTKQNLALAVKAAGLAAMHLLVYGQFNKESRENFFKSQRKYLAVLDRLVAASKSTTEKADSMGEPPTKAVH
jgi:hypothetical protein